MVPNSTLDNVKFDVFTTQETLASGSINDLITGTRMNEVPIAKGIVGHMAYLGFGKEGDSKANSERDRASMWRIYCRAPFDLDRALEGGVYVRVTARRHPETNGWVTQLTPMQYKVDFETSTLAVGRDKILSLSSLPRKANDAVTKP